MTTRMICKVVAKRCPHLANSAMLCGNDQQAEDWIVRRRLETLLTEALADPAAEFSDAEWAALRVALDLASERATVRVVTHLTPTQADEVWRAAEKAGQTVSAYVRERLGV
jgi:hypothetical protein